MLMALIGLLQTRPAVDPVHAASTYNATVQRDATMNACPACPCVRASRRAGIHGAAMHAVELGSAIWLSARVVILNLGARGWLGSSLYALFGYRMIFRIDAAILPAVVSFPPIGAPATIK
jgi:hypothetical protein